MLSRRTKLLDWNDPDPTTTGGGGTGGRDDAIIAATKASSSASVAAAGSGSGGSGGGGEDSPFDEPPLDKTHVRVATKLLTALFEEEDNADTHDGRIVVHNKIQNSPPRNNNNSDSNREEETTPVRKHDDGDDSEIDDVDVDDWEKFGSKFPRRNRFDAAAAAKKKMSAGIGVDVDVMLKSSSTNSASARDDDFPDPPIAIDQSLSFETNSTTTDCSEDSENYNTVTTTATMAAANANSSPTTEYTTIATGTGTTSAQQQHSPNTATTATTATGADDDDVDVDVDDLFANTGCTNLFSFSGIEHNGPVHNGLVAKAAAAATSCPTMPMMPSAEVVSGVSRNTSGGEKSVGDTHQTSSSGLKKNRVPSSSTTAMTPEDVYNRLTEFPSNSSNTMFCQQDYFCKTASDDDITPFSSSGLCNGNGNGNTTTTNKEDPDRRMKLTKRTTTFVPFDQHVNVVVNTPSKEDIDDVLDNYGVDDEDDDDDDDEEDVPLSPLGQQGQEQQQGIAAGCGTPVDFQNVVFDSFDDLQSKLSSVMDKVVSSASYCDVFESSTNVKNAAESSPEK